MVLRFVDKAKRYLELWELRRSISMMQCKTVPRTDCMVVLQVVFEQ